MGNLNETDYRSYRQLFDLVIDRLPAPALLVYLKAPVPILLKRIQQRARSMETGISSDYLELLDSYYVDWMNNFDTCPVLTIQSDDLDFVNKPQHLDLVVDKIQEKLSGKEKIVF